MSSAAFLTDWMGDMALAIQAERVEEIKKGQHLSEEDITDEGWKP